MQTVRCNVLSLLKARKLTGSKLAKRLNHSSSWASNFLTGKKTIPVQTVAEIADTLEVPVWQLLLPTDESHQGIRLSKGIERPLATVPGDTVPEAWESTTPMEVQEMSRDQHAPNPAALLACLSKEEQDEVLTDLKRRVIRAVSGESEGKASAV